MTPTLFSESLEEKLSQKSESDVLSSLALLKILYDEYGIDKKFSNNEFSEFGFYCPFMSEKIYLNAEIYEIDMKEYFNESIGFND